MKSKFSLFLIVVFVTSSLAFAVYAADGNVFDALLSPFGRLEEVYAKFGPFIDAIIYLIIFLGLAQVTIGKRFRKEGRAVTIGIGVILALSLALFEQKAGFSIASFGPIAALILIALMGYAFWVGVKQLEIEGVDDITIAAIAYLLVYFGVSATVPNITDWLNQNVPILGAILTLIALAFTIFIIYKVVLLIGHLFKRAPGEDVPGEEPPRTVAARRAAGRRPAEGAHHPRDELRVVESGIVGAMTELRKCIAKIGHEQEGFRDNMESAVGHLNSAIREARRIQHTRRYEHVHTDIRRIRDALEAIRGHIHTQHGGVEHMEATQIREVVPAYFMDDTLPALGTQLAAIRRLRESRGVAAPR